MRESLDSHQVEAWERDGFLVLEDFLDDDVLDELRRGYDEVIDGQVHVEGDRLLGGITRQVMLPSSAHATFDRNPAVRAAVRIGRQLFGTPDVHRSFDMLIYKPPGHPHETPWHQDMAYAGRPTAPAGTPIADGSIQVWVALDDADEENGCMHFVPGRHREPLLEHRVASADPDDPGRLLELADPGRDLDLSAVVAAPLRAGGCTMHTQGTPHYTPPNRSTVRPRRAYIFNVATDAGMRGLVGEQ
jgi:ectoine hydroxylase-related dioxygenase (phytanoyl-CoA dioxygenase family)